MAGPSDQYLDWLVCGVYKVPSYNWMCQGPVEDPVSEINSVFSSSPVQHLQIVPCKAHQPSHAGISRLYPLSHERMHLHGLPSVIGNCGNIMAPRGLQPRPQVKPHQYSRPHKRPIRLTK